MTENLSEKKERGVEVLINDLRTALEGDNRDEVVNIMNDIVDRVESATGLQGGAQAQYDEVQDAYLAYLGAGSGGNRLILRVDDSKYAGCIVFPLGDRIYKFKSGKTYADGFREVFGSLAENIQSDENPYFVVKVLDEKNKD